jgi:ribonuclease HI
LDITPLDRNVQIFSDSSYAIKCVTEWFQSWEQKGWLTSSKKPVENRDLVEEVVQRIRDREMCGVKTKFTWLKGHADDPGNVAADRLAVRGALEARVQSNGVSGQ